MKDTTLITNWTEVAQDAIECGRQAVSEVTALIKDIAPEIWEMCVRQVYADAITGLIGWLIAAIILFFSLKYIMTKEINSLEGNQEGIWIGCTVISVISGFTVLITFFTETLPAIKMFINPNYYAIQQFFKMIGQ